MTTRADKPRLDPATLRDLTQDGDGPRLLDVRTPGEFRTAHIPGSYNVPLDTLREHRDELLHHLDEDVIRICRSGARAAQAEQALAKPDCPTCASSTAASWRGRPPEARSPGARNAGTWSAKRQRSPEPSWWSPVSRACSCPDCT